MKLAKALMALLLIMSSGTAAMASIKPESKPITSLEKSNVVNVYNWQDYIAPDMLQRFEAETGIKVNYQTFDDVKMLESRVEHSLEDYDVVMPEIAFLAYQSGRGRFLKLDENKIPNLVNSDARLISKAQDAKYPKGYAANYLWGSLGIGYNKEMVISKMGSERSMAHWGSIFDLEGIAKLADCGVWIVDSPRDIYPVILNYLGENPNDLSEANLVKANQVLSRIRPYVKNFNSSDYFSALAEGRACVVVGWSGDVFQAAMLSEQAGNSQKIIYNIPEEGTIAWMDVMAIPANAKNIDNAYAFINFMLRPDNAGNNAEYVNYASANSPDKTQANADHFKNMSIYPNAEVMNRLFFSRVLDEDTHARINRYWRMALD